MSSLGKRLIQSAQEARAIARGEADASTYEVFVPAAVDVKKIRSRQGMTQQDFSVRYGLSVASVRDWEQGRYSPDPAARAYLTVIDRMPQAVEKALQQGSLHERKAPARKAPRSRARAKAGDRAHA
jgi:putative transcriptional regulator